MKAWFLFLGFLVSVHAGAKVLDCTSIDFKDFKFSDNCSDGAFKKGKNGGQFNPNCSVTTKVEDRELSVYYAKPGGHSDFLGLSEECHNSKGSKRSDLPDKCNIYFTFESAGQFDYKSCVCNKNGCGQIMIERLTEDEVKDLKSAVGEAGDGRETLLKRCHGNFTFTQPENDKTVAFVSSTECILRRGDTAFFDLGDKFEKFCVRDGASQEDLATAKERYRPTAWRISNEGRIYATICQPKSAEKIPENKPDPSKKNFKDYWPNYNKPKTTEN